MLVLIFYLNKRTWDDVCPFSYSGRFLDEFPAQIPCVRLW